VGRSVFFLDRRIAYEERAAGLLDADIGVVLHHDQDEAEYAARGRTADYLWAGLPSVLARGDEVGEEAGRAGAALLVPPHDIDATAQALLALVDPAARERAGAAARQLGEERRWTRVAAPLLELLDDLQPRRESSWPRLGAAVGAYYGRRLRQTLERGGGGAGGASARAARPGRSA
jgi:glycosyltransferase involved in cell wall biosynthesis